MLLSDWTVSAMLTVVVALLEVVVFTVPDPPVLRFRVLLLELVAKVRP